MAAHLWAKGDFLEKKEQADASWSLYSAHCSSALPWQFFAGIYHDGSAFFFLSDRIVLISPAVAHWKI